MQSFDDFAREIRDDAIRIGKTFTDPDDEWVPAMFLQSEDGKPLPIVDLTYGLRTIVGKQLMLQALPVIIEEMDAARAALILPSWLSVIQPNADGSDTHTDDRPEPHEDPNRREILSLTVCEHGRTESWNAQILRYATGPRLQPWQLHMGECGGAAFEALTGAFV